MLKGNLAGPTVWHAGETGHIYYLNTGCLVSDHRTQTRTSKHSKYPTLDSCIQTMA